MASPSGVLIHGRFTTLAQKAALVQTWPGIDPADVDAAVALAMEDGTVAGYEADSAGNPLLNIVVAVYRSSVPETLEYARDRMRDVHGNRYYQWGAAYAQGIDEQRAKLLAGARPFTPDRIAIEVVDLGANWDRQGGLVGRDVQKAQAARLAGLAVIYAASQDPEWVWQMDGERVPYALAASLLLNVPGFGEWGCMPLVWHRNTRTELRGNHVGYRLYNYSFPILRDYKKR